MDSMLSELVILRKRLDQISEGLIRFQSQTEELHIQYAPVIDDEIIYELSIRYELLNDETLTLLEPYLTDMTIETLDGMYKGKFILKQHLKKVISILGLSTNLNLTYIGDLEESLLEVNRMIFDIFFNLTQLLDKTDVYFGTLYYTRMRGINLKFAIDESSIYIIDHRHDIVPNIYTTVRSDLIEAIIKQICISSIDLEFYTMI